MRLKDEFRNTIVIQKSRFITCICPCRTEEEARSYINAVRKEFPDATHVCTAYSVGDTIRRSSDNKEPAGTAGVPMLEAINKSGVQDICACVVRYFGGIKLGAGGLVRASSSSVSTAVALAPKVIDVPAKEWLVQYPYELSGTIETWLRRNSSITDIAYDEQVSCTFISEDEDVARKLRDLSKGTVEAEYVDTVMLEKDA